MRRAADTLLLATTLTVTFEKLHAPDVRALTLTHVLGALFVATAVADRVRRRAGTIVRPAAAAAAFLAAFLLVWLGGFYNLDSRDALLQWEKGLAVHTLHLVFLTVAVAHVATRPRPVLWQVTGAFIAGIAVNAAYGMLQLGTALAGGDLDTLLVDRLGTRSINVYGRIGDVTIFRPNGLTEDPNHLGIGAATALLLLLPRYLRLPKDWRSSLPVAATLSLLLVTTAASLSRSAALGLTAGVFVLLLRHRFLPLARRAAVPLLVLLLAVGVVAVRSGDALETVVRSRLTPDASSASHLAVYGHIPDALAANPLLGLGLNTFSLRYELTTGRGDFGPHSIVVAVVVETGLLGALTYAAFLAYLVTRLRRLHRLGRSPTAARDDSGTRVKPLAWGLTACLAATVAANVFYLTMQFFYFYVLALVVVAAPTVVSRSANASASRRSNASRPCSRLT